MNAAYVRRYGLPATLRRRTAPGPDPATFVETEGRLIATREVRAILSDARWREERGPGGTLEAYGSAHVPADEFPDGDPDRTERVSLDVEGRTYLVTEIDPPRAGCRRLWLDYGTGAGDAGTVG